MLHAGKATIERRDNNDAGRSLKMIIITVGRGRVVLRVTTGHNGAVIDESTVEVASYDATGDNIWVKSTVPTTTNAIRDGALLALSRELLALEE